MNGVILMFILTRQMYKSPWEKHKVNLQNTKILEINGARLIIHVIPPPPPTLNMRGLIWNFDWRVRTYEVQFY